MLRCSIGHVTGWKLLFACVVVIPPYHDFSSCAISHVSSSGAISGQIRLTAYLYSWSWQNRYRACSILQDALTHVQDLAEAKVACADLVSNHVS